MINRLTSHEGSVRSKRMRTTFAAPSRGSPRRTRLTQGQQQHRHRERQRCVEQRGKEARGGTVPKEAPAYLYSASATLSLAGPRLTQMTQGESTETT